MLQQRKWLYLFLFSLLSLILLSCGEDHKPQVVRVVLRTNTPGMPVRLSDRDGLIVKDHWEYTRVLNYGEGTGVRASCEDPNTLLTGEIYVDGRLHSRKEKNRYLDFGYIYK